MRPIVLMLARDSIGGRQSMEHRGSNASSMPDATSPTRSACGFARGTHGFAVDSAGAASQPGGPLPLLLGTLMRMRLPFPSVPCRPLVSLVLLVAALLIATATHANVEPPVDLALDVAAKGARAGGYAFDGRLSLSLPDVPPNDEVTRVVVRFEARGGTATITPDRVTFDRPALATALGAVVDVVAARGGVEVAALASAYDADGNKLWGRADSVFILTDGGEPRIGRSSVQDLVRDDLAERFARGAVTQAEVDAANAALLLGEPGTASPAPASRGGRSGGARGLVATTTVRGNCTYVLRDGTTAAGPYRPIPNAFVQFVDHAPGGNVVVGPFAATDANGNYEASVPGMRQDGSAVELTVEVFTFRSVSGTVVAAVGPANQRSSVYLWRSGIVTVGAATTTVNLVAGPEFPTSQRAFSIFDVLNVGFDYLRSQSAAGFGNDPLGNPLDFVDFPGASANGAFFSSTGDIHLNIGQNFGFDWDVLLHEFGHYVQFLNGTLVGIGGQHFITGNNTGNNCALSSNGVCTLPRNPPLTKDEGTRLAWGEGWPTFFGTNLQLAVNAASFGAPTAGDTRYDDTANDFGVDLDDNTDLRRGRGEDNELSVQRALWDLSDGTNDESDAISLGTDLVLRVSLHPAKPVTLSQYWNLLLPQLPATSAADLIAQQIRAGAALGDHAISPVATAPADFTPVEETTPPPTFTWNTQGAGGSPNPIASYGPSYLLNRFNVKFFTGGFTTLVFTSPEIVTNGSTAQTASYTPSPADWALIKAAGRVLWTVEGRADNPAPTSGIYSSEARTLGGEESGVIPPDKATLACAGKAAATAAKLASAIAKCHVKSIAATFKAKAFDLAACEAKAATGYDEKMAGIKKCPACVGANAAALRTAIHTFADARNGDLYCAGAAALGGGLTGFVPPDKDALACAAKLTGAGTKLGSAVVKCHTKAASTAFKGKPFAVQACEDAAAAKYDKAVAGAKKCAACTLVGAGALRDAIETLQDGRNGSVYCAGTVPFPE